MSIAGTATKMIQSAVSDPPLELFTTETAFRPNPTTVRFSRTATISPGDVVFDIGTGIGPLAIHAAMVGASRVVAIDPVEMHCDLARKNVAKYGLDDKVAVYQGTFFDPLETEDKLRGLKANVIIGDVSGIADPIAKALGWYSTDVPTGGFDGTEVLVELLKRAGSYLAPGGWMYFPVAVDLSDGDKVLASARELYALVDNAMKRATTNFPMTDDEVRAVANAYNGAQPAYINIQQGKRRFWRGQIWKASEPR